MLDLFVLGSFMFVILLIKSFILELLDKYAVKIQF